MQHGCWNGVTSDILAFLLHRSKWNRTVLYYQAVWMDVCSSVTKCSVIKRLDLKVPISANMCMLTKFIRSSATATFVNHGGQPRRRSSTTAAFDRPPGRRLSIVHFSETCTNFKLASFMRQQRDCDVITLPWLWILHHKGQYRPI